MLWLAVEEEKENVRIYAMRVPHNLIEDFNLFGNENGVFYQTLACAFVNKRFLGTNFLLCQMPTQKFIRQSFCQSVTFN